MNLEQEKIFIEINDLIKIIKENITKINDIVIDNRIYLLKDKLNAKKEIHYRAKIKEDLRLNKIDNTLQKIYMNKLRFINNPEMLNKLNETYSKLESMLYSERNIILYCRNLRENEIDKIKKEIINENLKNEEFERDKDLIIAILNGFIYSLQINNLEGKYFKNDILTNNLIAFIDNNRKVNDKIIEYFKPIFKEFVFENCLSFSGTIKETKNLLLTKNITQILIETPNK